MPRVALSDRASATDESELPPKLVSFLYLLDQHNYVGTN